MRFVETPIFTNVIERLVGDEDYRSLQIALMLRPEQDRSSGAAEGSANSDGRDRGEGRAVACA
jgi:hypothetical protein